MLKHQNTRQKGPARTMSTLAVQAILLLFGLSTVSAATADSYLDMDLSDLLQVTITSVSKKEQTVADSAAAVFVISQEDIRRSGVTSIPEALAMAPGIQVARISASKWSISARGFAGYTSNKLLVMIDGRSVYSPSYSGVFWDMQHTLLEDIERIEVIRGPGGTIWGANAVNGVINIITKTAIESEGTLLRAGTGNEEHFLGAARFGGRIGEDTHARIYLTGNDRSSNQLTGSGLDAHDGWLSIQSGFRADGRVGGDRQWTLQGDIFTNQGDQIISPYWLEVPPFLSARKSELDNQGGNLLGRWQQSIDSGHRFTAQLYYDFSARSEEFFNFTFHTVDAELQYEGRLGDHHEFTVGAGYRHISSDNDNTTQAVIPSRSDSLYSIFVQDAVRLSDDRLTLTLGAKWEHNAFTGSEWQPSAKLLYRPDQHHSLWASVARAVHTPSVNEQQGRVLLLAIPPPMGPGTFRLTGSEDFQSETVVAYEAGYRWQPLPRFGLDLALFFNDYRSLYTVFPRQVADGIDMTYVNNGEGSGYGFEMAVDWTMHPRLRLILAYSFLTMDFSWKDPSFALEQFSGFIEGLTPKHLVSLRANADLAADWQFNAWLRYAGATEGRTSLDLLQVPQPVDDRLTLDCNLTWRMRDNLELMLAGQYLLNSSQLEYRSELLTPATEIERSLYAKITWRF